MVSAKSCPLTVGLRISRTPASPCICMFHDHAEIDSVFPIGCSSMSQPSSWSLFGQEITCTNIPLPYLLAFSTMERHMLGHETSVNKFLKRFISCNMCFLVTLGWNRKSTAEERLGKHNKGIWNILLLNNGWVLIFFCEMTTQNLPLWKYGFLCGFLSQNWKSSLYLLGVSLIGEMISKHFISGLWLDFSFLHQGLWSVKDFGFDEV